MADQDHQPRQQSQEQEQQQQPLHSQYPPSRPPNQLPVTPTTKEKPSWERTKLAIAGGSLVVGVIGASFTAVALSRSNSATPPVTTTETTTHRPHKSTASVSRSKYGYPPNTTRGSHSGSTRDGTITTYVAAASCYDPETTSAPESEDGIPDLTPTATLIASASTEPDSEHPFTDLYMITNSTLSTEDFSQYRQQNVPAEYMMPAASNGSRDYDPDMQYLSSGANTVDGIQITDAYDNGFQNVQQYAPIGYYQTPTAYPAPVASIQPSQTAYAQHEQYSIEEAPSSYTTKEKKPRKTHHSSKSKSTKSRRSRQEEAR